MRDVSELIAAHRARTTIRVQYSNAFPLRLFEMSVTIERSINE